MGQRIQVAVFCAALLLCASGLTALAQDPCKDGERSGLQLFPAAAIWELCAQARTPRRHRGLAAAACTALLPLHLASTFRPLLLACAACDYKKVPEPVDTDPASADTALGVSALLKLMLEGASGRLRHSQACTDVTAAPLSLA